MEYILYALLAVFLITLGVTIHYSYLQGKKVGSKEVLKLQVKMVFDQTVENFKLLNKKVKPNGVVFIGDFIFDNYNIHELFFGLHCYNRSFSGATTETFLQNTDVFIYELNPKRIVLHIGSNDLEFHQANETEITNKVKEIIKKIIYFDPNVQIILLSILPTSETIDKKLVGSRSLLRIKQLNLLLSEIKEVIFVDAYQRLIDETECLGSKYTYDGLHLNEEGYKALTAVLSPFLTKIKPLI